MVDDEQLMELYKNVSKDVREYSSRDRDTVRFFTTIFGILIAATVTFIGYCLPSLEKLWIISIIPIFMIFISVIGLKNYKREYVRLFEGVATLMKIEEKLGFHHKRHRAPKVVLKCDEYYLSTDYVEVGRKYRTTEEFIRDLLENPPKNRYGNAYVIFRQLFLIYILISIILLITIVLMPIFYL